MADIQLELTAARKILGPDAIIGVTASTIEEALKACEDGADYLGIGTVFATSTYVPLTISPLPPLSLPTLSNQHSMSRQHNQLTSNPCYFTH